MKFRIVKDGNNHFHVQMKGNIFDSWGTISHGNHFSEEEAQEFMDERILYYRDKKKKNKFIVIKTEKV
jgi:hypothetical protein